jgi:hypothetical protein
VPLSEDEQRILTEIEQQLYASDPGLARQVGTTTVFSGPFRRTRWAVLGLIVGLGLSLFLLQYSPWLSFFIGFGLMLASGWYLERNLRHLGRVSLQQVAQTVRSSGMREFFSNASERARDRMHRDDDPGEEPDEGE